MEFQNLSASLAASAEVNSPVNWSVNAAGPLPPALCPVHGDRQAIQRPFCRTDHLLRKTNDILAGLPPAPTRTCCFCQTPSTSAAMR